MAKKKKVVSADVARLAGVSRTTVSLVLNNVPGINISEETRRRVLEATSQLEYYPHAAARSLASRRSGNIGVVLCQSADRLFADMFLMEVLHGIHSVIRPQSFHILLEAVEEVTAPNAYFELVQSHQIDGLHLPYDAIVQVCDPATGDPLGPGEIGEVVVTLFEPTYCLIRFGTGDLSSYIDEPCPCGRTTPRLLGLAGRVGDAVKVRGLFIHPSQAVRALQRFPEITRYQIVVTRREHKDGMTLRCELHAGADPDRLAPALAEAIRQALRLRSAIEFVSPGTIPQDAKPILDERTWD